ncbi:TMV resistance protein N [Vitis vinifera]|uniref:TMV resistance protein N n=1 Tax=Vitis vinifera TaxID=29760 RepID=A0A438HFL5_VITVI|nr:TMV resistance protein N [Vitis vinifera]
MQICFEEERNETNCGTDFYHVDPSHVRHQKERFGEAFSNYKEDTEEMKEKVRSWRSALTEAANISGVHVKKNGYESEHVNEIVNDIFKRLNCKMLDVGDNLVGMDSHVNEIIRQLCVDQLNDVRIIGICGIGGMGDENVEAIFLDLSRSTPLEQLKVILPEDFQFPAHELRYLHWEGYSLKSLPSNFLGVNLIELNMKDSNIKQLGQGNERLEQLKILNLSGSRKLTEILFSNMPNLEKLELADCTSLNVVDPSIGDLKNLISLNLDRGKSYEALSHLHLDGCGIKELPSSIEHLTGLKGLFMSYCKNLRSLPRSICRLKSLLNLNLHGCSNLDTFPEIMEDMKCLEELDLRGSGIKELPSSIQNLKSLIDLCMSTCLVTLPDSIYNLRSLRHLMLRGCSNLEKFPKNLEGFCSLLQLDLSHSNLMEGSIPTEIWDLYSLVILNLSWNHMVSIPSGISQLCKLRYLHISHCKMLQDIPELPSSLREIDAHGCTKLEMLSSPSSLLWSSLLKWFNPTSNEHLNCKEGKRVVILGNGGIPGWVIHQEIGSQSEMRGDPDEVVDDHATRYWCTCDILNGYASDRLWYNRGATSINIKRCGVQLIYTHDYLHDNVPMLLDHQKAMMMPGKTKQMIRNHTLKD